MVQQHKGEDEAMARTESVSFQVHPDDEQSQINAMQRFHWNLLNTQEIKTVDSHLEQRGDSVYSVTKSEHYVKLSFTRDLDTPNLAEIRKLEQQYNTLPAIKRPDLFPGVWWLWGIASLFYGIGVIAWIAYFFLFYSPKKNAADALAEQNKTTRENIMKELEKYS